MRSGYIPPFVQCGQVLEAKCVGGGGSQLHLQVEAKTIKVPGDVLDVGVAVIRARCAEKWVWINNWRLRRTFEAMTCAVSECRSRANPWKGALSRTP